MATIAEQKILTEARDRLAKAIEDDGENRKLAKNDLEFIAIEGKQWPEAIRAEREADGRPCITINKMPVFIDQVVGDQRMNRPTIKVVPVDSKADTQTAHILGGWIKHVQQISKSDIAIDHGFEHAVASGYGAWRVVTKYISDDSFDQEAYIEKIDNALSVYWGKHIEYDCSDALYCFIVSDMDRDEYKDKYRREPIPFSSASSQYVEGWTTKATVRVVEYFVKEPVKKILYLLEDGSTTDTLREGDIKVNERKVESYKIMWYLLSGNAVLESREWVGKKYIPVIPIWGKEFNVAGKRVLRSLIRNAKDPQRAYNYWQALSLNTLLPSPDGWLSMKDVQVGYQLFDEKGQICTVTDISPVFENRDCVEVLFDDGSVIIADIKHLWTVEERWKENAPYYNWETKTLTTDQLIPRKHFIWLTEPLQLAEKELAISPYVLGVWLGDGNTDEPSITQSPSDWVELAKHLEYFGCKLGKLKNNDTCVNVTLLGLRSKFTKLGLLGNKHIPYEYVRGSFRQRLQLLQGLMDTDGSVNNLNGQCSFTTTLLELAKGFAELLRTLGIKAKYVVRNRNGGNVYDNAKMQYQFYFTTRLPVFRLSRKLVELGKVVAQERRTKRYGIKSITPVKSEPVKCVTVDSKSSLYLAGIGMIPTHNSSDTETVALQPKVPYVLTPIQIAGHEKQWKQAHRKNFPYLLANPDKDAPGWPHRETPPQVSSAMVEKLREADQEIRDTVGLQKASIGMQSNERSGAALREQKKEGDVGTFAFVDNLSRSLEHTGRILVDIAPGILDTERVVRLGLADGEFGFDTVNAEGPDGMIFNDLSIGTYDVVVSVGPSFTTQRTEAQQSIQQFIQYYPDAAPIIGDLYAKYMDWPGAEEVSQRLEFLLPPEIKAQMAAKAAKKAGEPAIPPVESPAPPEPNPQEQQQLAAGQIELEEAKIKLEQEKMKLEGLRIRNELMVKESKESLKAMMEEILKEDEGEGNAS